MNIKLSSVVALTLLVSSTTLLAQNPGTLDTSFGTSGKVITDLYGYQEINDVAIQSDGKIVSIGRSKHGTDYNFAVYRHLPNGTIDTSFGTNGGVFVDIKGTNRFDQANVVVIQPDGKILVAGSAGLATDNSTAHFGFIRLNTNGTLDTTFGTGGKTSFAVGNNSSTPNNRVFDMKLQSDGKIVAVGKASNTSSFSDFGIVRLNADGSLDTDFSNDGKYTVDLGYVLDEATHLNINTANGKILIAGETNSNLGLAMINDDGSLDTTFGTGGKMIVDFDNSLIFSGVAFQNDGKILVSGNESGDIVVYRVDANGTLDTSFGTNGKTITDLDSGSVDKSSKTLIIQPSGEIIVIGETNTGSTNYFALVRYTSSGQLDTTFSNDGIVLTNFGPGFNSTTSAVFQPDGKLVVAGFTGFSGQTALALARYNTGVTLNTQSNTISKINLYPNPVTDLITVEGVFEVNSHYRIFDALGREVKKGLIKSENSTSINVSNLSKGTYYINIDTFDVVKFIKN